LDYNHPSFGACTKVAAPGCRVIAGKDFVGDKFSPDGGHDEDPHDNCNGHGTHVAGIIGGDDRLNGMREIG
jgi:minor extracellular serine protease Vpr